MNNEDNIEEISGLIDLSKHSFSNPMFHSTFKIEWAERFCLIARSEWENWGNSGGLGWREEHNPNGHRIYAYAKRLPRALPLAVGTAIHSMRSALDAAVATLFEGVKGSRRRVSFPFHEDEATLKAELTNPKKHGHLTEAVPELFELITEDFKPWRSGNLPLWTLNRLDNIQKHQCLPIVASVTDVVFDYTTPEGTFSCGNLWRMHGSAEWLIAESRHQVLYSTPPAVKATPLLKGGGMAAEMPFNERALFPLLAEMLEETSRVLLAIERRFEGHPAMGNKFGTD